MRSWLKLQRSYYVYNHTLFKPNQAKPSQAISQRKELFIIIINLRDIRKKQAKLDSSQHNYFN